MPGVPESRHVIVTFGRSVNDEDLARLQEHADVVDAALFNIQVDEDHVHSHPVIGPHWPVGDPAV
jgi:hypothetical protein